MSQQQTVMQRYNEIILNALGKLDDGENMTVAEIIRETNVSRGGVLRATKRLREQGLVGVGPDRPSKGAVRKYPATSYYAIPQEPEQVEEEEVIEMQLSLLPDDGPTNRELMDALQKMEREAAEALARMNARLGRLLRSLGED